MHVHEEEAKKEKTEKSLEVASVEGRLQQTHIRFCVVRETDERDINRRWDHYRKPLSMETGK